MPAKQLRSGPETLRTACLLGRGSQALRCCLDSLSYQAETMCLLRLRLRHTPFGLLVSYRPLAGRSFDEDFLGP